ncbi:MAG TPA: hypothetical protein VGO55_12805 [Allosphingosinicella sp.]|jgi:hypothetical protein|nr:hypothetical protein [Allosphingosinicella sp.]
MPAFALLASAALAIPPPLERPGWYDCTVERRDSAGTVFVTRSIPPEGAVGPRQTLWRPAIRDEAVNVWADWEGPAPVRMASGRVHVLLFTTPARVEVRRIGPRGERDTRFAGLFPLPDRIAGAGIDWVPFLAMARGAAALEIAAVDADGHAIHSVRLRARDLERVAHLVAGVQSEFDTIVADYRHRCVLRGPRNVVPVR